MFVCCSGSVDFRECLEFDGAGLPGFSCIFVTTLSIYVVVLNKVAVRRVSRSFVVYSNK